MKEYSILSSVIGEIPILGLEPFVSLVPLLCS